MLALGFLVGLAFAPRVALSVGHHRAWPVHLVSAPYLRWKRRLPQRLMMLLDDAHRLGLLRTVGPIYQLRRAELQDHLARTYRAGSLHRPPPRLLLCGDRGDSPPQQGPGRAAGARSGVRAG
ncbi:hypothetical protein GCM10027570_06870 [Streptomonospora sediminis]